MLTNLASANERESTMPAMKGPTRSKLQPSPTASRTVNHQASESPLDQGDISLIRSMLAKTPTQRLERLQDFADGIMALRNGRVFRQ